MFENEMQANKQNSELNDNIILKRNEEGNLIKALDCEEIIKNYLNKNSIKFNNLKITKTNEGLSNYIYYVSVDNYLKLFLKIFNNKIDRKFEEKIISLNALQHNCARILDTDYEYYRIEEFLEYIQKLQRKEILTDKFFDVLLTKIINFNFLLYNENNIDTNNDYNTNHYGGDSYKEKNVFDILQQTFLNSQKSFAGFKKKFEQSKTTKNKFNFSIKENKFFYKAESENEEKPFDAFALENYEKIELYLTEGKLSEILNEIFPNEFLNKIKNRNSTCNEATVKVKDIPLFLSHNDVHLYNFLYKKPNFNNKNESYSYNCNENFCERNCSEFNSNCNNDNFKNNEQQIIFSEENIMLIDYEYACFNVIGFDVVNFFIECFFNLDFPQYPFYEKLESTTKKIYDKAYYDKYLKFLNDFSKNAINKNLKFYYNEEFKKENFFELFGSYEYYTKVCRLASIFWFYTALQFLDFESNVAKSGFNYVDYAADRLSVYENFYL